MPLLDRTGWIDDVWTRVSATEIGANAFALVPFGELADALPERVGGQALGVEIPNTADVEAFDPALLDGASLIAVAFPGFGDGRGFSLGKRLRRIGYKGRLRAVGPLIVDQFAFALACGFDEIELPEESAARQPAAQWLGAVAHLQNTYQPGPTGGPSIFARRRAARAGA